MLRLNGDFRTDFFAEQLQFHKNWNWLMEVVEKIESLGNNVEIFSFSCIIEPNDERDLFIQSGSVSLNKSKIDATYNAVLRFIKWYNLNKE